MIESSSSTMKNRRVGRILVAGVALLAFAGGARDIARATPVAPAAVSVAAIDPSMLHWYPPMARVAAIDPSMLHWYPPMANAAAATA